jgi:hypothetical protein
MVPERESDGVEEGALRRDMEGKTTGKYYPMSVSAILLVQTTNSLVRIADRFKEHQDCLASGNSRIIWWKTGQRDG